MKQILLLRNIITDIIKESAKVVLQEQAGVALILPIIKKSARVVLLVGTYN